MGELLEVKIENSRERKIESTDKKREERQRFLAGSAQAFGI